MLGCFPGKIPVVFTRVEYNANGLDGGLFVRKVPALRRLVAGEPLAEIDPALRPTPDDVVVVKQYPSAFFGTSLAATLTSLDVDTTILTGSSTSGCVRATAVDGLQHGPGPPYNHSNFTHPAYRRFRVIVPRECVGDRHPDPHEANLFDINSKYGDVLPRSQVLAYLRRR
ncbi:hypothetical protein CTAYLR_002676 [Chrysophaeum taylorii]|uniref:Isochorismatase-like domain-containing protein n=1 Tax=Chrysophaeum taylorii TaxID=2483200 RepID=A0AAD7UE19_9STRA|nr:hypothetical protein CTAYLR_002676 [Chrysophaeum taylorii]